MWRRPVVWGVLFSVLGWSACKKKDEVPPQVIIFSPNGGQYFNVYDTIQVSFQITDETELVSASVDVLNENFIPVTAKTSIQNYTGTASVILDDKLLETGDYFLQVAANDGSNVTREFVEIRIVAIPKERRAIYVATSNGSGQDQLWRVDSLMQQYAMWLQPQQDVLKLCVNSRQDQMALVGRYSTGIRSYDLSFQNLNWIDNLFSVSQTQRFMDLACGTNSLYTTIYDREIRQYGSNGALIRNFETGDYRPESVAVGEDRLLVEEALVGDDLHILNVYYEPTNALLWEVNFEMDIVGITFLEDNVVLVFGNDATQARVFHYNMENNSFWEPRQLPIGMVHSAVSLEGGSVAFTHDNGVYAYTYSPNFLQLIRPGTGYRQLQYDADNGTVLSSSANMLEELSPTGQLVNSIALPDSVVSFDIHYTR
jgi:hypothetical protein